MSENTSLSEEIVEIDRENSSSHDVERYRHRRFAGISGGRMKLTLAYARSALLREKSKEDNHKMTMTPKKELTKYPRALISLFEIGLGASVLGFAGFIIGVMQSTYPVQLYSSLALAIGTTTVALTLIQGQKIDERA